MHMILDERIASKTLTSVDPIPETLSIPSPLGDLPAQWWRSNSPRTLGSIFYLHGGGFMFGAPDDLPFEMINALTGWGHHIVAIGYPLAPEASLQMITTAVVTAYDWWVSHQQSVIGSVPLVQLIMGRSAGAYLAQALTATLINRHQLTPDGLILFYGYSHFDQPDFIHPSPTYLRYPLLKSTDVQHLMHQGLRTSAKPTECIPLYIHARQHGKWLELIGITRDDFAALDLRPYIPSFPRTFLAASTDDPDVPYPNTRMYHQHHPSSHLFTVQGKIHDFDQQDHAQRKALLNELHEWLLAKP